MKDYTPNTAADRTNRVGRGSVIMIEATISSVPTFDNMKFTVFHNFSFDRLTQLRTQQFIHLDDVNVYLGHFNLMLS